MTVFEAESQKVSNDDLSMMVNENCIEWLRGDTVATVSLCQKKLQNKIRKYAEDYPELFQIEAERDGVMVAHIPAACVKITYVSPREMSDEMREAARERLALYREEKKMKEALEKEEKEREKNEESNETEENSESTENSNAG